MNKKFNFKIEFNVFDSELTRSEFADYLIKAFHVGISQIATKDYKKFFWDLPSKYNENNDHD
jgi:hypothetical protein